MGRHAKAAVPRAVESTPAAEPARRDALEPISATEGMEGLLREARERQKAGKSLQNHHVRILRDSWLLDQSLHLWPTMALAAADLGVSLTTLRGYGDAGCPHLEPHSPIPKAPVLTWLLHRAHQVGGQQHANRDSIEEVELRIKLAKAEQVERRLVAEAEDRASQAVLDTMAELREQLLRELPARIASGARGAADLAAAEDQVIALLTDALRDRPLTTPTQET